MRSVLNFAVMSFMGALSYCVKRTGWVQVIANEECSNDAQEVKMQFDVSKCEFVFVSLLQF